MSQANSYISDDDLLDLADLELIGDMRIPPNMRTEFISWEQTRQPPVVLQSLPSVPEVAARKAQPTPKGRRRRKVVMGMSPIAEAPE